MPGAKEGIARHPQAAQPPLGEAVFFATPETATYLVNHPDGLSRFYVRLESFTQSGAKQAGKQLEERLRGMGLSVYYYAITDPNVHPEQQQLGALLVIMTVLGALSLGLSAFLIINMMNALAAQQVWQIGVMRSIGGTSAAILGIFLFEGVLVGVLSWLIAVPLSYPGARLLSEMVGQAFKLPLDFDYSLPGVVTWFAIVVVLSALASLLPALRATQVSVREALSYE